MQLIYIEVKIIYFFSRLQKKNLFVEDLFYVC